MHHYRRPHLFLPLVWPHASCRLSSSPLSDRIRFLTSGDFSPSDVIFTPPRLLGIRGVGLGDGLFSWMYLFRTVRYRTISYE